MSDSKKQSAIIKGNNNTLKQEINFYGAGYGTNDPNAIDPTEREILLRKVVEFERSLADFKKALQPPEVSATNP